MKTLKYTQEHYDFVRDNVVNTERDLANMFQEKFGIQMTVDRIENLKRKLHITSGLVGGRFQKGNISFNKGKKWSDFMSDTGMQGSLRTTFKKGNVPANRVPIGTERISKDGYVEIKVQDGHKNRNWKYKHRLVWEQHYGEIPKGSKIVFLDGNKLNLDIKNLKLLSPSEELIMNRQCLFTNNADLTNTGVALAKLIDKTRKCNKKR